ncbi:MAG TPA: TraR/DksA C4-type zinc finger protein [Gemmatimonadaceae bacterium]|nr:TraR/DksA C4-type zinc finger protein [Gemmatimonadaceae bacterium]
MNARRRAHFQQLLEQERRRALRVIERVREALPAGVAKGEPGEESEPGMAGATSLDDEAITARERASLEAIDRALQLMAATPERYGVCAICGEPIAESRLEVVPATFLCARHAGEQP